MAILSHIKKTGYKFLVLSKGPFINYVCTKGGGGLTGCKLFCKPGGCQGAANVFIKKQSEMKKTGSRAFANLTLSFVMSPRHRPFS